MGDTLQNVTSNSDWAIVSSTPYAELSILNPQGVILCTLQAEYVPIEAFQSIFAEISEIVKSGHYKAFIFDKRSLKAFHQPSMAWYYLEWKIEMLHYGLRLHRKLLPEETWFRKTVEIARKSLEPQIPTPAFAKLDIQYCESIEDALASLPE